MLTERSSLQRLCFFATTAPIVVAAAATPSAAQPIARPSSLNVGDSYRLAFVTSSTTAATSTDIADYNAFAAATANAQPLLSALGTTWAAIATTSTVDARDNTGTNPNIDTGVPIFLLNDTRLADNNADLWDGEIAVNLNVDEAGNNVGGLEVFTGTSVVDKLPFLTYLVTRLKTLRAQALQT